jgi:hypothetical protein
MMSALLRRRGGAALPQAAATALLAGVLACGARSSGNSSPGDPLASSDCASYIEAYRSCIGSMATPDVVDKRVEATRSMLARRAESQDAAAVRQFCTDQRKTLLASCH